MAIQTKKISEKEFSDLLSLSESHFVDLKGLKITPAKLSRSISGFANASGGELFVGIEEFEGVEGPERRWQGYENEEAANPVFQVLEVLNPLGSNYDAEFLSAEAASGLVLHLTIFKTQQIVPSTDGKVYKRRSAQNLPVAGEALDRLKLDKGFKTFEDEIINCNKEEITNSMAIIEFMIDTIPTGEPENWLIKQRIITDNKPTVAGIILYSDNPQAILPKRSAIKILRYATKKDAERDFLAFDPITIEGPAYTLIYDAVDRIKQEIEKIEKAGHHGMERVEYPEEAVHEILTNAVLHRDYSIPADIQVRIFDNRVEIESPGKLPGHVTIQNITRTQFARNPKLVRLVNKYKNPPNKDVGEGINTAFEAMDKIRLKKPEIEESEGSVVVRLKHESLASPEQMVMEYLASETEITNSEARELTGIKSENTMKQVFYKLRDSGQLEQVKVAGKKPAWRKPVPNDAD